MNPTEPKSAFFFMRANGQSLRSISAKLGIPKSTLFDWESDPPNRRMINVLKSLQLEKLQERYMPSFEEELQKLSTCLDRVEGALEKHDYGAMRPEFLLRISLQLRSRLHKLRADIQPVQTLNHGEIPAISGCISRSPTMFDPDEEQLANPAQSNGAKEATPDTTKKISEPDPSLSATCNGGHRTPVRHETSASQPPGINTPAPISTPDAERYGDLAIPLSLPIHQTLEEIAFAAGFDASKRPLHSSRNGESHHPECVAKGTREHHTNAT
jgi:hypothetical protein